MGWTLRERSARSLTFLLIEMLPVLVARIGEAFSGCAKMRGKDTLQMKRKCERPMVGRMRKEIIVAAVGTVGGEKDKAIS